MWMHPPPPQVKKKRRDWECSSLLVIYMVIGMFQKLGI